MDVNTRPSVRHGGTLSPAEGLSGYLNSTEFRRSANTIKNQQLSVVNGEATQWTDDAIKRDTPMIVVEHERWWWSGERDVEEWQGAGELNCLNAKLDLAKPCFSCQHNALVAQVC